jgi:hypothetical protein
MLLYTWIRIRPEQRSSRFVSLVFPCADTQDFYFLVDKPKQKAQLEMYGRRWKNNIKINLKDIGLEALDFLSSGRGSVKKTWTRKNSVAWVRERIIPTERPPLVGEVNVNFRG